MNPSTAQGRLMRDIVWSLIVKTNQDKCCKCSQQMSRETFSVEHIIPWLDSDDPVGLFFDIDNISFSHLKCNLADARRERAPCGKVSTYNNGCRCDACKKAQSDKIKRLGNHTPEKRRERYLRTGK